MLTTCLGSLALARSDLCLSTSANWQIERAAWHGTRIILRQTSPEAEDIFDMIISLHNTCHGDWCKLADQSGLDYSDVEAFLDYAACFLSNVGNYYASLSDP
jgi:hypothetical protein